MSIVTGIGGVLVAKRRIVDTFGLASGEMREERGERREERGEGRGEREREERREKEGERSETKGEEKTEEEERGRLWTYVS